MRQRRRCAAGRCACRLERVWLQPGLRRRRGRYFRRRELRVCPDALPSTAAACSTIRTQSAPAGTGAPVMISMAWPGSSAGPVQVSPARSWPTISKGTRGQISRAAGESVAGGAGKGRLVTVGEDWRSEDAAEAVEQGERFRAARALSRRWPVRAPCGRRQGSSARSKGKRAKPRRVPQSGL